MWQPAVPLLGLAQVDEARIGNQRISLSLDRRRLSLTLELDRFCLRSGLEQPSVGRAMGSFTNSIGLTLSFDLGSESLLLGLLPLVFEAFDVSLLHSGVIDRITEAIGILQVGELVVGDLDAERFRIPRERDLDRIAQYAALLGDALDVEPGPWRP